MSVNNSEMIAFQKALEALQNDIPEIMDRIVVQEGMYARDQARKICKEDGIVNTGNYRRNFKSGTKAIRAGNVYKIDVYNNLDYAGHLEYGFRGHWVPGYWDGGSFVYVKGYREGGRIGRNERQCLHKRSTGGTYRPIIQHITIRRPCPLRTGPFCLSREE